MEYGCTSEPHSSSRCRNTLIPNLAAVRTFGADDSQRQEGGSGPRMDRRQVESRIARRRRGGHRHPRERTSVGDCADIIPSTIAVHAAVVTFGVLSVVGPGATAFLLAKWHNRPGSSTADREPRRTDSGGRHNLSRRRRVKRRCRPSSVGRRPRAAAAVRLAPPWFETVGRTQASVRSDRESCSCLWPSDARCGLLRANPLLNLDWPTRRLDVALWPEIITTTPPTSPTGWRRRRLIEGTTPSW